MEQAIPYKRSHSIFCTLQEYSFNFGKTTRASKWFLKEELMSVLSDGGIIGNRANIKSYTRRQKPIAY